MIDVFGPAFGVTHERQRDRRPLVFGTDYAWIELWKKQNPDGLVATYVNSDAYTKSISDFVTTSRNTGMIIAEALRKFPGRKILVLPDKFLGYVMRAKALEEF